MLAENFCLTCGVSFRDYKARCRKGEPNIAYMARERVNIAFFLDIEAKLNAAPSRWVG
jgi:hypothetical protein